MAKSLFRAAVAACFALFSVCAARGEVRYVATTGSDTEGDGTASNPWRTIMRAITSGTTAAGDEIRVGGGLYEESVTNNVSLGGKDNLVFKGGYKADWTRDLTNSPTIVKPPTADWPCWLIENSVSNRVSGFVLTGGKFGIVPRGITTRTSPCSITKLYTILSQLIVTNNAVDGVLIGNLAKQNYQYCSDCVIASSLIAGNGGSGVYIHQDQANYYWIVNCTVVGNKKHGFETGYGTCRIFALNSIFHGNGTRDFSNNNSYNASAVERSCVGSLYSALGFGAASGLPSDDNLPLAGVFHFDPGLDADYSLANDSKCVKAGRDLTSHPWINADVVPEDLYGAAWGGAYDLGCVKSAGDNQRGFAASPDVYVAQSGDDAAAGTQEAPLATVEEGLYRTQAGGTCHVGEGSWATRANLFLDGQALEGAGIDKTCFSAAVETEAAVLMAAANGKLSGVTVRDSATGVRVETALNVVTNARIEACALRGNTNGVVQPAAFVNVLTAATYWPGAQLSRCLFTGNANAFYVASGWDLHYDAENCVFGRNDYGVYDVGKYSTSIGEANTVCHSTFVSNTCWAAYATVSDGSRPVWANNLFQGWSGIRYSGNGTTKFYANLFDCATNFFFTQSAAVQAKYDTNTCIYGAANIDCPPSLPGRLRAGSPAARAGRDLTGVACGVLAADFDGGARDPAAADIGAFVSPETKRTLNPNPTHFVHVTGDPDVYAEPVPPYGTAAVEEGTQTFSVADSVELYADGGWAVRVDDTHRARADGCAYTPAGGETVVTNDISIDVTLAADAELVWFWRPQVRLVVDAGAAGSKVSVNGGAPVACVTNWFFEGETASVVFIVDVTKELFDRWQGLPAGLDASSTSVVVTVAAPLEFSAVRIPGHYVSTTGSDTVGDGTAENPWRTINHALASGEIASGEGLIVQGGLYAEAVTNCTVDRLVMRGGYAADWTRDLRHSPSIIKPPVSTVPCLSVHSVSSNRIEGFVLTGGQYGISSRGTATKPSTADRRHVIHHYDKMIITNNAGYGVTTEGTGGGNGSGYMVTTSYIANNGNAGLQSRFDNWAYFYAWNCTVVNNKNYGLLFDYGYGAYAVKNCVFVNPGCDYNVGFVPTGNWLTLMHVCAYGAKKGFVSNCTDESLVFQDGIREFDPKFGDGFYLADDSLLIGNGEDISGHDLYTVSEDLYGVPWNGVYDYGCVKNVRQGAAPAQYADTYVSPDGDDANTGDAPERALKSPGLALARTAEYGTCHLAEGVYTNAIYLDREGVTLQGAGIGRTVLCGLKTAAPNRYQLVMCGRNVTARDLTSTGGVFGVYFSYPHCCSNAAVVNCEFKENTYGVYAHGIDTYNGSAYYQLQEQRDSAAKRPDNRLSHCVVSGNASHGVHSLRGQCTFIADNLLVANNGGTGFYAGAAKDTPSWLYYCTFADNQEAGIRNNIAGDGPEPRIYNSIVCGSPIGVKRSYYDDIYMYNCVVSGNDANFVITSTSYPFKNTNDVTTAAMTWDHLAAKFPYHPAAGSPAVGWAVDRVDARVVVADDLAGVSRDRVKRVAGCYLNRLDTGTCLLLR